MLVYLDAGEIAGLLAALAGRAAAGSVLAVSLAIHPDGIDSRLAVEIANSRRRDSGAEPWKTILSAGEHLDLLRQAGWHVADGDSEQAPGVTGGRSLFVSATR